MEVEAVKNWANEDFKDIFLSRLFVDAIKTIRDHKSRGVKVVLVTGALDFTVQPLADFLQVDALMAAKLEEKTGKFTGKLVGHPIVDGHKAEAIRDFASRFEIDLSASYAYGDSMSDLEMLKCVGQPIAVNPDSKLLKAAKKAGWKICYWKNHPGIIR
jgi:HAD superfamily hydrolase (TIGR01490 family)